MKWGKAKQENDAGTITNAYNLCLKKNASIPVAMAKEVINKNTCFDSRKLNTQLDVNIRIHNLIKRPLSDTGCNGCLSSVAAGVDLLSNLIIPQFSKIKSRRTYTPPKYCVTL